MNTFSTKQLRKHTFRLDYLNSLVDEWDFELHVTLNGYSYYHSNDNGYIRIQKFNEWRVEVDKNTFGRTSPKLYDELGMIGHYLKRLHVQNPIPKNH